MTERRASHWEKASYNDALCQGDSFLHMVRLLAKLLDGVQPNF